MIDSIDNVTIIFGDSITYGLYDKESCGWVNRVRKRLEQKTNNNFIFNLGIPGEDSSHIKERFEIELKNRYNTADNFILIFSFGIKDALILKDKPNHIKRYKENIEYIIKISKKYTNNIYFVGLFDPDYSKRPNYCKENVYKIDNALKEICKLNKVEYINIKDIVLENELIDGLHPNDNGHNKIASIILEQVYNCK